MLSCSFVKIVTINVRSKYNMVVANETWPNG